MNDKEWQFVPHQVFGNGTCCEKYETCRECCVPRLRWLTDQADRRAAAPQPPEPGRPRGAGLRWDTWLPIESAPLDGTSVLLLIADADYALTDDETVVSIGSYGVHGGPEHDPAWSFAGWDWCQDKYRRGVGTPTHWRPLPGVQVREDKGASPEGLGEPGRLSGEREAFEEWWKSSGLGLSEYTGWLAWQARAAAGSDEGAVVAIPKTEMDAAESGEIPDWASPLMTVHQHGADYAVGRLAAMLGVKDWDCDGGTDTYEGDLQHSIRGVLSAAAGCPGDDFKVVPDCKPAAQSEREALIAKWLKTQQSTTAWVMFALEVYESLKQEPPR